MITGPFVSEPPTEFTLSIHTRGSFPPGAGVPLLLEGRNLNRVKGESEGKRLIFAPIGLVLGEIGKYGDVPRGTF